MAEFSISASFQNLEVNGDQLLTSSASTKPVLTLENTTNDALSAQLKFIKNRGDNAGEDNDLCGVIDFWGNDDSKTQTNYAKILGEVSDATDNEEVGKLSFQVASSDGTSTSLSNGIILTGTSNSNLSTSTDSLLTSIQTPQPDDFDSTGILSITSSDITVTRSGIQINTNDLAFDLFISVDDTHNLYLFIDCYLVLCA